MIQFSYIKKGFEATYVNGAVTIVGPDLNSAITLTGEPGAMVTDAIRIVDALAGE